MSESIVKPLVWIDEQDGNGEHHDWRAQTPLEKEYRVLRAFWGKEDKWGFVCTDGDDVWYHSEVEGKAAAQSDYEARILSALSPSFASLQEQNEALKAALERILCMHDGNPPLPLADIPEIDYARRTISNIHREVRAALQGGQDNG